jgi:hypothetical protein
LECARQRYICRAFHFTGHRCVEKFMTGFRIDGHTIKRDKLACLHIGLSCLTTDSLPRGYPRQLFGLRHVLELDDEHRDSRFILVQALDRDRVITVRLVSVSLCVGLIVLSCLLLQGCP